MKVPRAENDGLPHQHPWNRGDGGGVQVAVGETEAFRFLEPGELRDGDMSLRLVATQPADPTKNWVPYYVFHIMSATTGYRAGEIHLRVGNTEHMRLYGGHVAYGVRPEFRGNHFA